jgi:urea carboxylase
VGYPVMLKSTAGGGGIGMRVCYSAAELSEAFAAVRGWAKQLQRCGRVYRKVHRARPPSGSANLWRRQGEVIALGVRDCSVQRRNQKVLEETPAPNLPAGMESAVRGGHSLGKAVNYRSAGTVEFVYDSAAARFYFLEVNTRLQVEHGVTEQVWGVDLVRWMISWPPGICLRWLSWPPGLPPGARHSGAFMPKIRAVSFSLRRPVDRRGFSAGGRRHVAYRPLGGAGCEVPPFLTRCWRRLSPGNRPR